MENDTKKKSPAVCGCKYPGVAIDEADNNKVTPEMVDEETKSLNNGPDDVIE